MPRALLSFTLCAGGLGIGCCLLLCSVSVFVVAGLVNVLPFKFFLVGMIVK